MLAILCEHAAGKWPFWLSLRQGIICSISEKYIEYADAVYCRLKMDGYAVEVDRTNITLHEKVRNAQLAQYNYIAAVGEEEKAHCQVDLRDKDKKERLVIFFYHT